MTQITRGVYIAAVGKPDLAFGSVIASQVSELNKSCAKNFNKLIIQAKASIDFCLKFILVDKSSIRLVVLCDANFALNQYVTLRLGFFTALANATGNANIIHYLSLESKHVTRSVLVGDLFAAVHAFVFSSTLCSSLNSMFGYSVSLILYTDSKSLFDSIMGLNLTNEKATVDGPLRSPSEL